MRVLPIRSTFTFTLVLLPRRCDPGEAQGGRPPYSPAVIETPWGQRVVPLLAGSRARRLNGLKPKHGRGAGCYLQAVEVKAGSARSRDQPGIVVVAITQNARWKAHWIVRG